jgi:hypothetical protein
MASKKRRPVRRFFVDGSGRPNKAVIARSKATKQSIFRLAAFWIASLRSQ